MHICSPGDNLQVTLPYRTDVLTSREGCKCSRIIPFLAAPWSHPSPHEQRKVAALQGPDVTLGIVIRGSTHPA